MLGEFASLKSKHDGGVASNGLPRRYAPRNDDNTCGRSMIEMLGVLAIIGVLSVGGIAGYSKAMERYKINKTIEQITQITYNIFSAYANQKTMDELSSYGKANLELMKSLGFIPEDMEIFTTEDGEGNIKNVFGGEFYVVGAFDCYNTSSGKFCAKNVNFELTNISKEACLTLGSYNWSNASKAVIGVGIANNATDAMAMPDECWFHNSNVLAYKDWLVVCNNGISDDETDKVIPLPIPPAIIAQHCNCKENTCYFSVSFTDR